MSNHEPLFELNKHPIIAGAMAGNLTSGTIDIAEVSGYCVHAIWTGAPVGNIIIQGSNDDVNYKAVVTTAAGGALGQLLSNQSAQHYRYLQVIYTATSGTGVLDVYVSGKRIS